MIELGAVGRWPEAVFHVLAHVGGTAHLPASLYDRTYVALAERWLGPAASRPLGEDAELLGRLLSTHDALAGAHLLGWLFGSVAQARAAAARDLGELGPGDVAEPALVAPLAAAGPALEVLRAAAELELDALARLPPMAYDAAALRAALVRAEQVAPALAGCRVALARPLRLRGRVRGRDIWLGVPCAELGPDVQHVAWQASHEATVHEVSLAAQRLGVARSERSTEGVALVLLARRAAACGRQQAHQRWLAHFGPAATRAAGRELDRAAAQLLAACGQRRG